MDGYMKKLILFFSCLCSTSLALCMDGPARPETDAAGPRAHTSPPAPLSYTRIKHPLLLLAIPAKLAPPQLLSTACLLCDLRTKPDDALRFVQKTARDAKRALKAHGEIAQKRRIIQEAEQACPIALLDECTTMTFDHIKHLPCTFSRLHSPHIRASFETKVVEALSHGPKTGSVIHYVSFGSGHMFQELVILTKLLTRMPDKSVFVHLIDLEYSPAPDVDASIEPAAIPAQEEVLTFLQKSFPTANICIKLYANTKQYLDYAKSNVYPDVISAIDVDDGYCLETGAVEAYESLCATCIHDAHREIPNFLYLRGRPEGAKCRTISLQKKCKATDYHTEGDLTYAILDRAA